MTTENNIEIKSQDKFWLLKGILCLVFMLTSLLVALFPLISDFAKAHSTTFYISGGIAFVAATALFAFLLYKECKPNNALILSAHGFIDNINVGENIEIEWTNVVSVKMLGKANMPFLGITLENTDIVLAQMKKNQAEEMRENIDQNLPTILIPQSSVRKSIKDLKELFAKFVREARALESDTPKKPKSNPFTTDDVLRAFGKLPVEESIEDDASVVEVESVSKPFEILDEMPTPDTETPIEEKHPPVSDSFYEALRAKATAKSDIDTSELDTNVFDIEESATETITCEHNDDTESNNEEIPNEIEELLSKAKSNRISELEKLLTDVEFPYSASRINSDPSTLTTETDKAFQEVISKDEESFDEAVFADTDIIPEEETELTPDTDTKNELTLDSLIEDALRSSVEHIDSDETSDSPIVDIEINGSTHDSNADTKEFILDIPEPFGYDLKKSASSEMTDFNNSDNDN